MTISEVPPDRPRCHAWSQARDTTLRGPQQAPCRIRHIARRAGSAEPCVAAGIPCLSHDFPHQMLVEVIDVAKRPPPVRQAHRAHDLQRAQLQRED